MFSIAIYLHPRSTAALTRERDSLFRVTTSFPSQSPICYTPRVFLNFQWVGIRHETLCAKVASKRVETSRRRHTHTHIHFILASFVFESEFLRAETLFFWARARQSFLMFVPPLRAFLPLPFSLDPFKMHTWKMHSKIQWIWLRCRVSVFLEIHDVYRRNKWEKRRWETSVEYIISKLYLNKTYSSYSFYTAKFFNYIKLWILGLSKPSLKINNKTVFTPNRSLSIIKHDAEVCETF